MDPQKQKEFVQNFNQHRSAIRSFFLHKGFNSTESEDMTQETFLEAFKGLEGFRGESEFKTWLDRIAVNVFNRAIRSNKARKRDAQEGSLEDVTPDTIPHSASPWSDTSEPKGRHEGQQLESLVARERLESVRGAVAELPLQMQRCIVLYSFQQRTYKQIADVMKLNINTVKSHIYQARRRLKGRLGDLFDGFGR